MAVPLHVLFVGVGGQGVLSAARFLGEAGHLTGLQVTVSQLHGMSQRGGTVESMVCLGSERIVPKARPNVLVGLELLETLRALRTVRAETVLANQLLLVPPGVARADVRIPDETEIEAELAQLAKDVRILPANSLAQRAGAPSAINVVMLGALSRRANFPIPPEAFYRAIHATTRSSESLANECAFELGRAATC